jgi:hypothetical protein
MTNDTDQNYNSGDMRAIMVKVADAFIGLRDGSNNVGQYNRLAAAMNIGIVRSESIGEGAVEVFRAAQRALLDADAIYEALHCYTFTPAGLVDLAKGVQGYSELPKMSTPAQMEQARAECARRLAAGHSLAPSNKPSVH